MSEGQESEISVDHEEVDNHTLFSHITQAIEGDEIVSPYSGKDALTGSFQGADFNIRVPHLRRGKHAFVGVVDITEPNGKSMSVVVRNDPRDVDHYKKLVNKHPIAKKYLPNLLDEVGVWAVIERLSGLEYTEIVEKLQSDPEFLQIYAAKAWETISETAKAGLRMQDVAFVDGHNVFFDSESGQTRLVEQISLVEEVGDSSDEIAAKQLFFEVERGSIRHGNPLRYDFSFQLLKNALRLNSPEAFYRRGSVISPRNDLYKSRYFYANNLQNIDEDVYQELLKKESFDKGDYVPRRQSGKTHVLSDEAIAAVRNDDLDSYKELVEAKKVLVALSSSDDIRSMPVIEED